MVKYTHTHWWFECVFFSVYLFFYLFTFCSSFVFFSKTKCGSFDLRLFYFYLMLNALTLRGIGERFFFPFLFTGILIVNQSQQRTHQIANDLHINAVQRNDSGRYTCAKITSDQQSQQVEILNNIKLEIICKYIHLFGYVSMRACVSLFEWWPLWKRWWGQCVYKYDLNRVKSWMCGNLSPFV